MQIILLSALLIFSLRIIDVSLATLRLLMVMRGRKGLAWIFGFFQALIFIIAIRVVLADIGNWQNLVGYAAGFATGNVVGMMVEERLAIGFTHVRIISSRRGNKVAEHLRGAGFAVTEISGRGKDGTVTLLNCSVRRKRAPLVRTLVEEIDTEAMVTAENIRTIRKGFW
jgi:uncharacterized protein YebE (UPF0316 family)